MGLEQDPNEKWFVDCYQQGDAETTPTTTYEAPGEHAAEALAECALRYFVRTCVRKDTCFGQSPLPFPDGGRMSFAGKLNGWIDNTWVVGAHEEDWPDPEHVYESKEQAILWGRAMGEYHGGSFVVGRVRACVPDRAITRTWVQDLVERLDEYISEDEWGCEEPIVEADASAIDDLLNRIRSWAVERKVMRRWFVIESMETITDEPIEVESSNLATVHYNGLTRQFTVKFRNGRSYRYDEVGAPVIEGFHFAASKGKYFRSQIMNQFQYTELKN